MAGQKPKKNKSEYGMQMAEKQKLRGTYGLRERQFKNYFAKAHAPQDVFAALELRLDSVVHRLGMTKTHAAARQMVGHGHIMVNGRRVTIPSFRVRIGDVISVRPQSEGKGIFLELSKQWEKYEGPSWLRLDKEKKQGVAASSPSLEEAGTDFNIKTVMEFYTR